MRKKYNSQDEVYAELKERYNKDVPDSVVDLWDKIVNYAYACAEESEEGNSGEFHNEQDAKELRKKTRAAFSALVNTFALQTGYKPVLVRIKNRFYVLNPKSAGEDYHILHVLDYAQFEKINL